MESRNSKYKRATVPSVSLNRGHGSAFALGFYFILCPVYEIEKSFQRKGIFVEYKISEFDFPFPFLPCLSIEDTEARLHLDSTLYHVLFMRLKNRSSATVSFAPLEQLNFAPKNTIPLPITF